ncbi:MAG: methyltransferase domain-containing protein [Actinomycetota bacterium]|nr:methyltransferase domain-containing protein [Actinomycetota bacterium]
MTTPTMTPTLEQTRAAWDDLATRFDEFQTPLTIPLGQEALQRANLRSGNRFLDVAAGSGGLAIPAARLGAQVVATDLAPKMVELLLARAREEGLTNLEGNVMDGHSLDLEDDTFDVSGSLNGVSIFPDLKRGLRELVRVTKPGGRALIVAFGAPAKVEFLGFFLGAIRAAVPGFGLPANPPHNPFQVADPQKLRQELAEAGLTDVRVDTVTWSMKLQSAAHLWDFVTTGSPIGAGLVADLTPEQATGVRQVLDGMLRERSGGSPTAVLNTEMNIGLGTK